MKPDTPLISLFHGKINSKFYLYFQYYKCIFLLIFKCDKVGLIEDIQFENGIIELEISGEPAVDAPPGSRGFVGVAFRIDSVNYSNYECIYLRPVNGRSDNQLQRNHSVQYISHPEYPWYRLRKEHPGVYESYVDLVPGEWISIRIVVSGQSAQLYVHENFQPTLMINDLKHGERGGQIGLWLHTSTVAHYRNLRITHSD